MPLLRLYCGALQLSPWHDAAIVALVAVVLATVVALVVVVLAAVVALVVVVLAAVVALVVVVLAAVVATHPGAIWTDTFLSTRSSKSPLHSSR